MTKDTQFQINVTTNDCVTPNVPRIRSSFFNRKFRDISGGSDGLTLLTPSTPKVNNSRTKISSTTRSRSRRSGGGTNGSARAKTGSPKNGRPARSRPIVNDLCDQDFSTPRASRTLLTPPKTTTRLGKGGRVTHMIYQPLELDNESSSEPSDAFKKMYESETGKSPLAIDAPYAEVTLTILDNQSNAKGEETPSKKIETKRETKTPPKLSAKEMEHQLDVFPKLMQKQQKVIETICISDSEDDNDNSKESKKRKCEHTSTQDEIKICSPIKKPKKMLVNGSPYMSQPETPPDDDHVVEPKLIAKITKFIPGNCNIDDILSLCSKKDTNEDIKAKDNMSKSSAKVKA